MNLGKLFIASTVGFLTTTSVIQATGPNIIFVLTDDLGWGDLGILYQNNRAQAGHGQPCEFTPCLDQLAADGVQLPAHYCAAPVCAPSRASILLGLSQGHANLRDNQFDKALENNHTMANVLRQAGYATVAIGKWGIQGYGPGENNPETWPAFPTKRGFDRFFGYARHSDGHEHYPKEAIYTEGCQPKEVWNDNTNVTSGLDKCYTTDLWTAWAKQWIVQHQREHADQPFFMYLAYDTPHAVTELPTQAYPEGGGLKGGLKWLGKPGRMINTASGEVDSWIHPDYRNATYDNDKNPATQEVPWPNVYKRYATAVRRIDSAMGDLRQLLQDLHIATNTLVVFSSDNGPSMESYLKDEPLRADFFNSFGPFDGIKRDCWEGGERVPTLACWPGHIPAGSMDLLPSISYDWLPTFAEVAGLPIPANADGISLLPELTGLSKVVRRDCLYVEYYHNGRTPDYPEFSVCHRNRKRNQMQVLRVGDYVGVRYDIKSAADPFEIYHVTTDPKETNNLASTMPEMEQRLQALALQSRMPNNTSPRPYDSAPMPASTNTVFTNGIVAYAVYEGQWPWLPDFATLKPLRQGHVAGLDLAVRPRDENFGIAFSGFITVPATGSYTFCLKDDGGACLRIHDAMVIDDDFNHKGEPVYGTVRLAAGRHPFRLYYCHTTGPQTLLLACTGPGVSNDLVSLSMFSLAGMADSKPQLFNDYGETSENASLMIPVLANDTDDGLPEPLHLSGLIQPKHGRVDQIGNEVRYTPAKDFVGRDQFYYSATDGINTATATVTVVILRNETLCFPLDQSAGRLIYSETGGVTAILEGFPEDKEQWVEGIRNQALQFDGNDESVMVDKSYQPPSGKRPRTTTAWVKTCDSGSVVAWGPNDRAQKWVMRVEDDLRFQGVLRVEVGNAFVRGAHNLRDGRWHFVAAVLPPETNPDAKDIKLFVDGAAELVMDCKPGEINTEAAQVTIGTDCQGRFFKGIINDVRIYDRALTAAEIESLYAQYKPVIQSSLPNAMEQMNVKTQL